LATKQALLFEKRSKDFDGSACVLNEINALKSKSFLVLFFKKEPISRRPFLACHDRSGHRP
jgi:hypothetical protein